MLRPLGAMILIVLCFVSVSGAQETESERGGFPPITSADWSTYNHDVRGWRFNSSENRLSPANADQLELKWRFPREGQPPIGVIHATPTVVRGHVYFGTATDTAFYKLNPDGTLAWVFDPNTGAATHKIQENGRNTIRVDNGILSSALVTDDSVFFGDGAGVFYALNRSDGRLLWRVNTRAAGFPGHHPINVFHASPILAAGKVIVGGGGYEHPYPLDPSYPCCTGRGFVVAFEPRSGKLVWKYDVGEEPQKFDPPLIIEDSKGKHVFQSGPSTSSVWSTPSYDAASGAIFFGTDVHNSPRKPTPENPNLHTRYSAAVISLDVETGEERWVTQINEGDIFNQTMAGYDARTGKYKDGSIGDTPKLYSIEYDGQRESVVGVGCKNGGFYLLRARDGKRLANTPTYTGPPSRPLQPQPDPRMIALPGLIGGIQTGCATDGERLFTNGIDWLSLNTGRAGRPEGGRVVSLTLDLGEEYWRHERPQVRGFFGRSGDPVAAGLALGGGIVCFAPAVSERLVVLSAATGEVLKEFDIGVVWSGPSISRGRIYIGTGSVLFLKKQKQGVLHCFGLPGEDEVSGISAE